MTPEQFEQLDHDDWYEKKEKSDIEYLLRQCAWLMRIASKEINESVEAHNKNKEPWHHRDAMTSFELDKLAYNIEQTLKGTGYFMSYPSDINDLQHELKCWTEKQFPNRDTASICAHLRKETYEVLEAPKDVMEYADCMMLLLDAASYNGVRSSDIVRACYEKLAINKDRKWGEPNDQGFVEHVE